MRRASVDLGTNTCLLLIAEWDPARLEVVSVVEDHANIVRLGKGVDQDGLLQPAATERALTCLREYAGHVRARGLDPAQATCVATSQARDAKNGAEFFARVEQDTGFCFRVISGAEEARLTFLGGLPSGLAAAAAVVIDIGGGSTEIIAQSGGESIDVGSVRFTERYLKSDPVTDEEFWACQAAIDSALEKRLTWRAGLPAEITLIAVAGTATTLAQWQLEMPVFNAPTVDACVLTRGDVHRMVEDLKWRTVAERRLLPGITEGRADVLLAGALILWRTMELLSFNEARISTRGLRFGVLGI